MIESHTRVSRRPKRIEVPKKSNLIPTFGRDKFGYNKFNLLSDMSLGTNA
jgi:hypothetical protein